MYFGWLSKQAPKEGTGSLVTWTGDRLTPAPKWWMEIRNIFLAWVQNCITIRLSLIFWKQFLVCHSGLCLCSTEIQPPCFVTLTFSCTVPPLMHVWTIASWIGWPDNNKGTLLSLELLLKIYISELSSTVSYGIKLVLLNPEERCYPKSVKVIVLLYPLRQDSSVSNKHFLSVPP